MRLSRIKLAGFKSFVDATQLPLPVNLTAVVGPNGCGKSNIIDAVRWVLGEASIKTLRGSDSEDVIFNGSRSRKPAGRASVELLFDNSDGQIEGPYAAYAEISVRRELSRDGNSQYYLNSRKCLKRDVTDLFLGTGLGGKNQYAIIEQGMVSRMVEAKPEELRHWLEEAAGISKYKERRRDTESRIRQTRENLARLQDLQNEIDKRVEVLAKQAENAQKYRDLKEDERQAKAELLLLRARSLKAQSLAHEAAIADFAVALDAAKARILDAETAQLAAEAGQSAAAQALNAEQALLFDTEARAARADQSLQHARELLAMQRREQQQSLARLAELEARLLRETQREAESAAVLEQTADQLEAMTQASAAAQARAADADEVLHEVQTNWDTVSSEAQTPLLEAEGERVRVQQLDRSLRAGDERAARLAAERDSLKPDPLRISLLDADADLATIGGELSGSQARAEEVAAELASLREQRASHERELNETRQTLGTARGRLASLETLQQAALREDDKDYRAWLERHGFRDTQRLADLLRVQPAWEAAVEHVLQVFLQAPVLPAAANLHAAPAAGPRAGGALVSGDGAAPSLAPDSLAHQVEGPAAILQWLAPIRACEQAGEAAGLAETLGAGESVISPDGVWRGRGWLRYPQGDPSKSGVLARGTELRGLREKVRQLEAALRDSEAQLAALSGQAQKLEIERRDLVNKLDQLRSRQAQRLSFRQAQAVRLEQMQNRLQTLEQEAAQLATQREQFVAEIEGARLRLVDLDAAAERARSARALAQGRLAEARANAQSARALAAQVQQRTNEARLAQASRQAAGEAIARGIVDLRQQIANAAQQAQALADRVAEAEKPLQAQGESLAAVQHEVAAARERLRAARLALEVAEAARQQTAQARRASESHKDAAAERLQTARLEFENLRTRLETLAAQFAETGFEREPLEEGLPLAASEAAWEERLGQLARRIDRLGAINLAAIGELEEARERQAYYAAQRADVEQALTTLEDAMRQLDGETEDRFRETFDRVNSIFRDRFPKIFGGGEAYLELTGKDLDAGDQSWGVRVMARPPGKRNSSIQLLSGGEKAMTAVALLLALFELNPAPFCLMDEVDAPLDDANVSRYCEVLREMSQRVQFIIITHNKITMELASRLHGVTMQEPGVSRLVSVDVEQALEYAAPSETAAEAGT